MDDAQLLHNTRREHALYRELVAAYHAMASALRDECAPVDPAWLKQTETQTEATVTALRNVAAVLAPHRLSGTAVPPETTALWAESARLATEAAELGAETIRLAKIRQQAVASRLAKLATGRRAVAAYQPAAAHAQRA